MTTEPNKTRRVYMVTADGYAMGRTMPVRLATGKTLAQMIERCAHDLHGESSTIGGRVGHADLVVRVVVCDMECEDE